MGVPFDGGFVLPYCSPASNVAFGRPIWRWFRIIISSVRLESVRIPFPTPAGGWGWGWHPFRRRGWEGREVTFPTEIRPIARNYPWKGQKTRFLGPIPSVAVCQFVLLSGQFSAGCGFVPDQTVIRKASPGKRGYATALNSHFLVPQKRGTTIPTHFAPRTVSSGRRFRFRPESYKLSQKYPTKEALF